MRVSGLLHYGLQLPDLAQGKDFYTDFGLNVDEHGDRLVVRCDGRDQDQTLLVEGHDKRLHHVAFATPEGSLPELQRHLESLGITLLDAPAGGPEGGLWFRDPDGNAVNVRERNSPRRGPENRSSRTWPATTGEWTGPAGSARTPRRARAGWATCWSSPRT
ncbi:VOC family protein [Streptomyces diastatochromogenes]|nr:VOC family protein [Streptomyces diastatochromogenes]